MIFLETKILLVYRFLFTLVRHVPNEVPARTNYAISLNLGGTMPACPRLRTQHTPSYASKNEKGNAWKQDTEEGREEEGKEERDENC